MQQEMSPWEWPGIVTESLSFWQRRHRRTTFMRNVGLRPRSIGHASPAESGQIRPPRYLQHFQRDNLMEHRSLTSVRSREKSREGECSAYQRGSPQQTAIGPMDYLLARFCTG
jgi:hypothetical protein